MNTSIVVELQAWSIVKKMFICHWGKNSKSYLLQELLIIFISMTVGLFDTEAKKKTFKQFGQISAIYLVYVLLNYSSLVAPPFTFLQHILDSKLLI